jgi:hypothetical protein
MCRGLGQNQSSVSLEDLAALGTNFLKRPLEDDSEDCASISPLDCHTTGKWTVEEEKYAAALICQFERGALIDCEEGKTLRSFLAEKLNCIPMRVSKKYGGTCIGKLLYAHILYTESEEEERKMEQLAQDCVNSIHLKLEKRMKRQKVSLPTQQSSCCDASSEESVFSSPNCTDTEMDFADDFCFENFMSSTLWLDSTDCSAERGIECVKAMGTATSEADWSHLPDECLLVA